MHVVLQNLTCLTYHYACSTEETVFRDFLEISANAFEFVENLEHCSLDTTTYIVLYLEYITLI